MTDVPAILDGLPILWAGVDDTTPDGCTLLSTEYLGIPTTYIIRDGQVIGRIEISRHQQAGYAGDRLKGGYLVGFSDSRTLGARILARHQKDQQHEQQIRALDAGQPDHARNFPRT